MKPEKLNKAKQLIIGVFSLIGLLALFMLVSHFILISSGRSIAGYTTALFISRTLFWLTTLCMYLYTVKVEKQSFLVLHSERKNIGFYALSVVLLLMAVFAASIFASAFLKVTGLYQGQSKMYLLLLHILYKNRFLFIFTTVTAGVVEELLFRGYLLTRLQMLFQNNYLPVIISSLLFGILHIGYGTVQNVVVPMFIGAVLAVYYLRYKNIWVPIIAHGLYDFLVISLAFHLHLHNGR